MVYEIKDEKGHDAFIANNDSVVIFFGSKNCGHCVRMSPIINQMESKYNNVKFAHVETTALDVENISGVPVFVGYDRQVPIDVIVGADPDKITRMIESKLLK